MALSLAWLAAVYLLGAVPVGYLVARAFGGVDIRRHGSGNIGATNVLRTLGKGPAALTFAGDVAKGWAAVWLAGGIGPEPWWEPAGAFVAIVGNCWSVFLGFRGGKGVATTLGAFLRLMPLATLPAALVWAIVVLTFRYVSLASLTAAFCLPPGAFLLGYPVESLLASLAAVLIVMFRHRDNLARLHTGTEPKLGERAPAS
ncbi:MAG: glycerol-3-phosphate 1-O-acyltransferase PlsY [Candidatus Rokubacteria bacterium]|nr:glycerol-3-phosphate 1-O-acyltransferase PlsY [Candidatus Rokubacteria bacterium]